MVVAPDKFKGTYTAREVAAALAAGARATGAAVLELPVADGGEGTADTLVSACGGAWRTARVHDALGREVDARYGVLEGGRTAVIDAAEASGLSRLKPTELDPWKASSAGTGELIATAIEEGAEQIILGAGGTATLDGGQGAVEVLSRIPRLPQLLVACDVAATWDEASSLFGAQKGVTDHNRRRIERRLDQIAATAPTNPTGVPHGGCGGGLSGALWSYFGATLCSGAKLVLDALRFDRILESAIIVITGEGRIDAQTARGKAVFEIAQRCEKVSRPCYAVVGRNELSTEMRDRLGLAMIVEARDAPGMTRASQMLVRRSREKRKSYA